MVELFFALNCPEVVKLCVFLIINLLSSISIFPCVEKEFLALFVPVKIREALFFKLMLCPIKLSKP